MNGHGSQLRLALVLLVGALALSSCEEEGRSSQRGMGGGGAAKAGGAAAAGKAAGAAAAASGGAEAAPDDEAPLHEHEESAQFRDPFRSYLAEFQRKAEGPVDDDSPRSPTEMYDVGQFTLIGVITGTPVPKAMLQDPTGFAHVVRPGDRLGKQGGRVAAIYGNEVVVTTPNPRLGDEEARLTLYPAGQGDIEQYGLAIVESSAEEKKAAGPDEERFLQQLDLQQILRSSAAARQQASARATASGGGDGDGARPTGARDLPPIPVVPVVLQPSPAGGTRPQPGDDAQDKR